MQGLQVAKEITFVTSEYVPAGQLVPAILLTKQYYPAGQSVIVDIPVVGHL